jgi:hypothetical protein
MTTVARFGLSIAVPSGWEAAIYRRPQDDDGSAPHPVLHAGSFPLPAGRGDYGSGAVDAMGADDVLIALLEFAPASRDTTLFTPDGVPRALAPQQFSRTTLQRAIPGHAGTQSFCRESGRAFCLYVVLGSWQRVNELVRRVNAVLPAIRIDPAGA